VLKIDIVASSDSQGELTSRTSLGLHFRQSCQFQHFISYLTMVWGCHFLCTRCFWSSDLWKKLPNIKH